MIFNSSQRISFMILFSLFAIGFTGCAEEIDYQYGKNSTESVNGTAVFRTMLNKAGFTTRTRYSLRPEVGRKSDVIIWFPNDLDPPTQKQIQWFDTWLAGQGGRTLIYVGRDFDCEPLYWTVVQKRGLSANPASVTAHLTISTSRVARDLSTVTLPINTSWFDKAKLATPGLVGTLSGPWSASVNMPKHEIHANSTLSSGSSWSNGAPLLSVQTGPPKKLTTEDFVLEETVTATGWSPNSSTNTSRRIVINNGSFLLNYALVNKEHRVIADHLVQHLAGATNVTFIESNQGGPPVQDTDNFSEHPNGWSLFNIQPLGTILFHLALIGIVFCFMRWPIFGRTRQEASSSFFDFGLHLKAIASLLRISKDTTEAQRRVAQYQAMQRELSKRGIVKSNTQKN